MEQFFGFRLCNKQVINESLTQDEVIEQLYNTYLDIRNNDLTEFKNNLVIHENDNIDKNILDKNVSINDLSEQGSEILTNLLVNNLNVEEFRNKTYGLECRYGSFIDRVFELNSIKVLKDFVVIPLEFKLPDYSVLIFIVKDINDKTFIVKSLDLFSDEKLMQVLRFNSIQTKDFNETGIRNASNIVRYASFYNMDKNDTFNNFKSLSKSIYSTNRGVMQKYLNYKVIEISKNSIKQIIINILKNV